MKRNGRSTCCGCRKPLDNGQPLTTATTPAKMYHRNSIGDMIRIHTDTEVLAPWHEACLNASLITDAQYRIRDLREQLEEASERIRPRILERLAVAEAVLAELENI